MIECPSCETIASSVTDSRKVEQTIRRRRVCASCETRWTTYEVSASAYQTLAELNAFHEGGLAGPQSSLDAARS